MLLRPCRKQLSGKSACWPIVSLVQHKSSAVKYLNENSDPTQEEYENAHPYSSIPGPKGIPWFGRWLEYYRNPRRIDRRDLVLKELYDEYGFVVKETVAGRDFIHLFHPDHMKQIFESESKYPIIPALLESVQNYRKDKDLAPGLGNSNGEVWYRLRSVVQHIMLRPQKSLDYLSGQNKVASDFVNKLESLIGHNGEIPQFNRWISRWGLESAANNVFDKRMGFLEDEGQATADRIIDTNNNVFDLSVKLHYALPWFKLFPTPSLKKIYELEDFINGEAVRLLNEACERYRKALEDGTLTEDRFRFLSYMLSSENVSDKDIVPVTLSVFTDTLSTTSQALLFNLYCLASNPGAQEKAYEEAKQILSPTGELTVDGFNSCTYIKACMKETFRLLPIGYDILRLSPSNMVVGGYQIPEGTYLCLNNYVYALDPKNVSQPEVFLPERWLREESGKEKIHPYLLTPFSLGRRMCAGRRFAEQELVTMIAKILSHYKLEWHHGKLHQRFRLLCVPDQEVKVTFIPR